MIARAHAAAPVPLLLSMLVLLATPVLAQTVTVDNGLAPPNPANVFNGGVDFLTVRDQGCAGAPLPCPSPGPSTAVEVQGGFLEEFEIYDSSTGIMTGGSIEFTTIRHAGTLEMMGGAASNVRAFDDAQVQWTRGFTGDFGQVTMNGSSNIEITGGGIEGIVFRDSSTGEMSAGSLLDSGFFVTNNARFSMSGGEVRALIGVGVHEQGFLDWTGGRIGGEVESKGEAVIRIAGQDFMIDGAPVGLGEISATSGVLTGTLRHGQSINNQFFRLDDGLGNIGRIILVPEPTTALLVALGLVGLALRRRDSALR